MVSTVTTALRLAGTLARPWLQAAITLLPDGGVGPQVVGPQDGAVIATVTATIRNDPGAAACVSIGIQADACSDVEQAVTGVSCVTGASAFDFFVTVAISDDAGRPYVTTGCGATVASALGRASCGRAVAVTVVRTYTAGKRALHAVVRFDRGPSARAVRAAWVGNALATALEDEIDAKALTRVDVQALHHRASLIQRQVAFLQAHWDVLLDARPGMAQVWVWRAHRDACEVVWDAVAEDETDKWECPLLGLGYASLRQLLKSLADKKAKEAADAADAAKAEGAPLAAAATRTLDAVVAFLPAADAAAVRARAASPADGDKTKEWAQLFARLPLGLYWNHDKAAAAAATATATAAAEALRTAEQALDACVHGMPRAKAALLQVVAQTIRAPKSRVRAIGLCGPPGTGKTSLATKGLAVALGGRPSQLLQLGGAKDASLLVGHDFTYSGSRPGRVVDALVTARCMNPILVLDEIDKVQGAGVTNVVMGLTDPTQNGAFVDHYVGLAPLDLSRAIVVCTFNDITLVDPVLLDRLHIVHVDAPSAAERLHIARAYLLPRIAKDVGIVPTPGVSDDALASLIARGDGEQGMRTVEKLLERAMLGSIVRCMRGCTADDAGAATVAAVAEVASSAGDSTAGASTAGVLTLDDDIQRALKDASSGAGNSHANYRHMFS
jgi:hypothetical protein